MYEQETTKYRIHLTVQAEGVVERSDVVGAIFGQVEGLLGSELELRELQRQGKLGRIDVKVQSRLGRSSGDITVATSLDRAETAILAASMETVTRIGPCAAEISVEAIEDIRITKRSQIIERAKALLLEYEEPGIDPESLIDAVRESQRMEKIETIGQDNVPAGPNVLTSDAIIVVEGRADVINLLKAGIKNAVAVEGTSVPETIIQMCRKKTATAFLDGDRGGDLILRELLEVTDIDFVAYPPRGESVEDLSRKEIIKALRNKVPIDYVMDGRVADYLQTLEVSQNVMADPGFPEPAVVEDPSSRTTGEHHEPNAVPEDPPVQDLPDEPSEQPVLDPDELTAGTYEQRSVFFHINEIKNRGKARLIMKGGEVAGELPYTDLEDGAFESDGELEGVIIDHEVNQQLLDQLSLLGIQYLAAPAFSGIVRRPAQVRLIAFR